MSNVDWHNMIDFFGRRLLSELGYDPDNLPRDRNPITEALKDPNFVYNWMEGRTRTVKGEIYPITIENVQRGQVALNRKSLSVLATICQMVVFDAQNGPEQDGERKGLRRHWYQWYKVHFAQPLALMLDNIASVSEMDDTLWAGRLSETYAMFVDDLGVTYHDLWVQDASRMMEGFEFELFRDANIIVAVEKDSLFGDFRRAAEALGARCIISGKGKNSKAAIEKMLRDYFGYGRERWNDDLGTYMPHNPFTAANPLYVLHISDHDYDGHEVIGPTFGTQIRRYSPHVIEARVGIKPEDMVSKGYQVADSMYQVKATNKSYVEWAHRHALFAAQCINSDCNANTLTRGATPNAPGRYAWSDYCARCDSPLLFLSVSENTPYGLEVEAMRTRDYRSLMVDALLSVMDYDHIVERLRIETTGEPWEATEYIARETARKNDDYAALEAEIQRLETIRLRFIEEIHDDVYPISDQHKGDFADDGDDPADNAYTGYVERARGFGPWRPFSVERRTGLLQNYVLEAEEYRPLLQEFEDRAIEWQVADDYDDPDDYA